MRTVVRKHGYQAAVRTAKAAAAGSCTALIALFIDPGGAILVWSAPLVLAAGTAVTICLYILDELAPAGESASHHRFGSMGIAVAATMTSATAGALPVLHFAADPMSPWAFVLTCLIAFWLNLMTIYRTSEQGSIATT